MILESLLGIEPRGTVNLKHPRDPALADLFGPPPVRSGVNVNSDTVWNYSAVYCAVTIITNAFRAMPFFAFQEQADGGKKKAKDHPTHRILHRRPNPETRPSQFKAYMQACALLWDGAYAEIVRDASGQVQALWPIHPSRVTPVRDNSMKLWFRVFEENGEVTDLPEYRVFRLYGTSKDGVTGMSIRRLAAEAIGLGLATEMYGATFFGNGARPATAVKTQGLLEDVAVERLRTQLDQVHGGGPLNSNKTIVLEEGAEFQVIGMPNDVAQFLETRRFQIEEVARWFNVPPHRLKDLTHATYDNITDESVSFDNDSVKPWVVVWEEEANEKLFTQRDQEAGYYAKYQMNSLLRGDPKGRAEFYRILWNMGAITENEIRALEEMNPMENGGEAFVPKNMTPLSRALEPPQIPPAFGGPAPGDDEDQEDKEGEEGEEDEEEKSPAFLKRAFLPMFEDAFERLRRKEKRELARAAKQWASDEARYAKWATEFFDDHRGAVTEAVQHPAHALSIAILRDQHDNARRHALLGYFTGLVKRWVDEIRAGNDPRPAEWAEQEFDRVLGLMREVEECNHANANT